MQVSNFAVAPSSIAAAASASQMVAKLIGKLSPQRRNRHRCSKSARRISPRSFSSASCGFRAVSVLRDFYEDTPEDAYVMQYRYRMSEIPDVVPFNQITRRAG